MQLAAAGRRRIILNFLCLFDEKNVTGALEWGYGNHIQIFIWGGYVRKSHFTAELAYY